MSQCNNLYVFQYVRFQRYVCVHHIGLGLVRWYPHYVDIHANVFNMDPYLKHSFVNSVPNHI